MTVKYVVVAVIDGATKEFRFPRGEKAEAVALFKDVLLRADRARLFSIDSDDPEIWYDLSNKV